MTSRQFANYNGGAVKHPADDIPDDDIPADDIPVNDIPVMPMKKPDKQEVLASFDDILNKNLPSVSAPTPAPSTYTSIVTKVDDDIPDNDVPVNDVPANDVPVMPMKKTVPMEKSDGWHKTALSKAGMKGDVMTFRDDRGYLQVELKKIDTATVRNLLSVARGSDAKWRVRWFSDSNGVRHATEVLTDEQYREYSKAAWQNRKLWREGFATANPFTA